MSVQMRYSTMLVVIAATLFVVGASAALAQSASPGGGTSVTIPASSIADPHDLGVRAHTNIRMLGAPGKFKGVSQLTGPPFPGYFYEDPASLACIYHLVQPTVPGCNPNVVTANPNGGGRAIAIVDAFDDPNAYSDLQTFSAQFGVAPITSSSFQVVYAPSGGATPGSCTGPATQPPNAGIYGWDVEESLDIEYSHSMAPAATLYLVEAQTNYFSDLLCAVSVASNLVAAAGGGEVSMSWGGGEFSAETAGDPVFTTPKVVYFASSGDSPGTIWPSVSPNVVAVGGTTLSTNPVTGNFTFENGWQEAGSGPSAYESRPHYQDGIKFIVGSQRGVPDVSSDANPYTGVWVLDTVVFGPGTWYIVGGTSVSSPTWAGIVNAAGSFSASSNAELTKLYRDRYWNFNDIILGSCGSYLGYFASVGWDYCSGLGSPHTYGRPNGR